MTPWLRRQRALADYTLAALARRRGKNAALVAVYALVVFALASAMFFAAALRHETTQVLQDAPEITVQKILMGRQDLVPAATVEKIAGIRGVTRAEGRLWGYFYDRTNGANYTVMVPGDKAMEPPAGSVALGEGIPRARGFTWDGAPLFLSRFEGDLQKFEVVRTFTRASGLMTSDLVLMNGADFRAFFGIPEGLYTDVVARVRNPREVDTVVAKAGALMPEMRFVTRAAIQRSYQKLFSWREGLLAALIGAAVLAFVIFAAEKASGLSAEETREIGILKAVGWDTRDIIAMKLWEGALVSGGAFLIGTVAGFAHVFFFGGTLFAPVLKGWAVLYPEFDLAPQVDGVQLLSLALLTTLPYVAATLVPIWRTASADPDAVMR
ncbi:MAG: FtsX-like permease family protein [Paracoccaceae bacterium]